MTKRVRFLTIPTISGSVLFSYFGHDTACDSDFFLSAVHHKAPEHCPPVQTLHEALQINQIPSWTRSVSSPYTGFGGVLRYNSPSSPALQYGHIQILFPERVMMDCAFLASSTTAFLLWGFLLDQFHYGCVVACIEVATLEDSPKMIRTL